MKVSNAAIPLLSLCTTIGTTSAFHPRLQSVNLISKALLTQMSASSSSSPSSSAAPNKQKAVQDWDVDKYQSQHNFVWKYGTSLVDLLDPQPGEVILDVGCGTGELVNEISNRGATAMGCDADKSMVARAQTQFPEQKFFQAYAQELELPHGNEPVDAIFSNAALHWVPDPEGAVKAMSKALKPGGRFVVEFGGKGNVEQITTAVSEFLDDPNASPWYFPSISEYTSLLEKHGIEVTSAVLFDRPTVLDEGADGMRNWIRMFGDAFLKHLDDEKVEELLTYVDNKLRPTMYDGDKWTADYRRIRIVGRKVDG